jgi:hypothetical protein
LIASITPPSGPLSLHLCPLPGISPHENCDGRGWPADPKSWQFFCEQVRTRRALIVQAPHVLMGAGQYKEQVMRFLLRPFIWLLRFLLKPFTSAFWLPHSTGGIEILIRALDPNTHKKMSIRGNEPNKGHIIYCDPRVPEEFWVTYQHNGPCETVRVVNLKAKRGDRGWWQFTVVFERGQIVDKHVEVSSDSLGDRKVLKAFNRFSDDDFGLLRRSCSEGTESLTQIKIRRI